MKNNKIICVKNLTRKFNGFTAVDDVSFEVNEGEVFGFLGPNGAGKTTTINMLTTLLKPTYGKVTINGYDLKKEKDKVRESLGIVFQEPTLDLELTAYENLYFHGILYCVKHKLLPSRIKNVLKLVDLWDKKDLLVKTFSGGMKRRLEIARGLVHHPKILFLDEPTLGLDPQTRKHIWDYISDLQKKERITIFLTTHYLAETELCNKIAIIDRGKIVEIGSPKKLKAKYGKNTVEDIFLSITGDGIRDEEVSNEDMYRQKMADRARKGKF
jgi:ABC-2 type transport system ATP-binding protein